MIELITRWIIKAFIGIAPFVAWFPMGTPLFHLPNRHLFWLVLDDFFPTSENFFSFSPLPTDYCLLHTASLGLFPKSRGIVRIAQGFVRTGIGSVRAGIGSARVAPGSARAAQGSVRIAQGTLPNFEGKERRRIFFHQDTPLESGASTGTKKEER